MGRGNDDEGAVKTGVTRRRHSGMVVAAAREGETDDGSERAPTSKSSIRPAVSRELARRPSILVDKLFEQCAFERINVRLYDATLAKLGEPCVFEGGPTREQLKDMARAELTHFQLLATTLLAFGKDPTKEAGAAFVPSVALIRLHDLVATGDASFIEILHALLLAELADNDGWAQLVEVCEAADELHLAHRFREALEIETHHLACVRSWISAHAIAGISARRDGRG